jgi:predicted DNA-binding transcriptional regulator YafY
VRRTERLFAITEVLRGRRTGITAEELAGRFGVTLRTVYRDLASLRDADLPLNADRGRGGGYALDRSYSLPPVNFTAREAALLVTAGQFLLRMRLLPFDATIEVALDKVRAALPAGAQRELGGLLERLSFVGVPGRTASLEVRRAVEEALVERRPIRIRYLGQKGPSERTVRIDGIVLERTETLLNCEDLELGERRQLRLHLVEWAAPLPAPVPPTPTPTPEGPRATSSPRPAFPPAASAVAKPPRWRARRPSGAGSGHR